MTALRSAIDKAIRPTLLIGLQDADLSGPGGTQRINEWADWITDALLPLVEAEQAIAAHLTANQIRDDTDPQVARQFRREPLLVLLSRMQRGVLRAAERPLLRAAVETELTDGDEAHVRATQLGELLEVAHQTSNTAEAVRAEAVADNERLRATLAAVRTAVAEAREHSETWGALDHRCGGDHLAAIEAAFDGTAPTADDEQARRNAVLDAAQARADRETVNRVRELAERWEDALAPDLPYARSLLAALDGVAPNPDPTGCPHVREGGCCHGPGRCAHACEPDPERADRLHPATPKES